MKFENCISRDSFVKRSGRRILCPALALILALLLQTSCVSRMLPSVKNKLLPAPQTAFLQNADAYFYISDKQLLSKFARIYNFDDWRILSAVHSLSASAVKDMSYVFIRLSDKAGLSNAKKRERLMYKIGAVSADESGFNWLVRYQDRQYLINTAYENGLFIINSPDTKLVQKIQFISQLPMIVQFLNVTDEHAFWLSIDTEAFKQYFKIQEIQPGYGAAAIREYNPEDDVSTDIAFPYEGDRVGFASLKLLLPFLLKSIEADILGSLPGVDFKNNMIAVRGLRLPQKIVQPFIDLFLQQQIIDVLDKAVPAPSVSEAKKADDF